MVYLWIWLSFVLGSVVMLVIVVLAYSPWKFPIDAYKDDAVVASRWVKLLLRTYEDDCDACGVHPFGQQAAPSPQQPEVSSPIGSVQAGAIHVAVAGVYDGPAQSIPPCTGSSSNIHGSNNSPNSACLPSTPDPQERHLAQSGVKQPEQLQVEEERRVQKKSLLMAVGSTRDGLVQETAAMVSLAPQRLAPANSAHPVLYQLPALQYNFRHACPHCAATLCFGCIACALP